MATICDEHDSSTKIESVCLPTARAERNPTHINLFLFLLAAYCAWVFSLPLFPTQDGPVHLYYVEVIRHLLRSDSYFNAFYLLRTPPPPYIVHYALLYLLTGFLQPVLAEKCMVCLIIASTAFGFRYLSTIVGVKGNLMSLFVLPITLSWPLFMGFHNYCLAVSLCVWSFAFWLRGSGPQAMDSRGRTIWFRAAFFASVLLLLFTHPVPLLLLVTLLAFDVARRLLIASAEPGRSWRAVLRSMKAAFALSGGAFLLSLYVLLFVSHSHAEQTLKQPGARMSVLIGAARLTFMSFGTSGILAKLCRGGLLAILLFALTLAFYKIKREWRPLRYCSLSSLLFLSSLAVIVAVPVLPPDMNGSEHFSSRLLMFVWLTALAAASDSGHLTQRFERGTLLAAVGFSLVYLGTAEYYLRPIARQAAEMENTTVAPARAGLFFDTASQINNRYLTFNPFLPWEAARYFRRAGAVLINDPWTSPPFPLPLRSRANRLTEIISPDRRIDPVKLHERLMRSPEARETLMSSIDLLVFVGRYSSSATFPDELIAIDHARRWHCEGPSWYVACRPLSKSPVLSAKNRTFLTQMSPPKSTTLDDQ